MQLRESSNETNPESYGESSDFLQLYTGKFIMLGAQRWIS